MSEPLQAWVIGIFRDYDETWSEFEVYAARSRDEALTLAAPEGRKWRTEEEGGDYRVERRGGLDRYVGDDPIPRRLNPTMREFREAGWRWDGDEECQCCGEIYGDGDPVWVCPDCCLCPQCRAEDKDEDCPCLKAGAAS